MRRVIPVVFILTVSIAALLLASCSPSANTDQQRYIKLHYDNTSGEKGVTIFDGSLDKPNLSIWELLDGSRYSINYFTYDGRGNMILKERFFTEGRISKNIYEYDDQNRLIAERFERSDGREGSSTYIYESDRLVRADHQGHNGWLVCLLDYHYDDAGQCVSATILSRSDEDTAGTITYTYNDYGNLTKEDWVLDQGWGQNFEREYASVPNGPVSYTSANPFIRNLEGIRIATENYDYSGKVGGPSYYEYENGGNCLTLKRFVRSDGQETVTHYIYHPDGRLLRSHRAYADGKTGLFRYEYNDKGYLVRKEYFLSTGDNGSESYTYDEQGRLVAAEYDKMDSWLTGTLTFEHDENGGLKSGHFIGNNDLEADISYVLDERDNPTEIHWEFSDGTTQTYNFTYEAI